MESRQSFLLYRSFAEVMAELPDAEAGKLYKAIAAYALDGEEPELSGYLAGYFRLIKPQLDANNNRYKNGLKGGRPKKETTGNKEEKPVETAEKTDGNEEEKPKENQNETTPQPNENENENENENVNVNNKGSGAKSPRAKFIKPTLAELKAYAAENNLELDAEDFMDYYESNKWRVGRNPMVDWKATARRWSRKNSSQDHIKPQKKDDSIEQLQKIEQQALRKGAAI